MTTRCESYTDFTPKRLFHGWLVVLDTEGKPGVIPPLGADPADCPSEAVLFMTQLLEETMEDEYRLQFFSYGPDDPYVSKPFHELACSIIQLPKNPERDKALDHLMSAKDAAVRAKLLK